MLRTFSRPLSSARRSRSLSAFMPAPDNTALPTGDTISAEFRKLLAEVTANGGAPDARTEKLLRENFRMREKLRIALTDAAAAQSKAVAPKDGELLLNKDDAVLFNKWKASGVKVEELPTIIAERDALRGEKQERDADKVLDTVADMLDVNPLAFRRLVKAEQLTVSVITQKVRNDAGELTDEQVPVVVKRGAPADAKPEPLTDVLERDYAADIPLLSSVPAGGGLQRNQGERTAPLTQEDYGAATRFPRTASAPPNGAAAARKAEEAALDRKQHSGVYSI